MRVKIGRFWYNSEENNICLEFEEHELDFIKDMQHGDGCVAFYNTSGPANNEAILEWMNE